MLNIYKYYDDAKTLLLYNELGNKIKLVNYPSDWLDGNYTKEDFDPIKHIILKKPRLIYYYALDILKSECTEGEPIIIQDPKWAYMYAVRILKRRWPEAEPIIQQSEWRYRYKDKFGIA
jgi:hypothetical protein